MLEARTCINDRGQRDCDDCDISTDSQLQKVKTKLPVTFSHFVRFSAKKQQNSEKSALFL